MPSGYVVTAGDLRIDYSKQRIDDDVLAALFAVAEAAGVEARRDAMFGGEAINVTEHRAVLHTALRATRDADMGPMAPDGTRTNVEPDVHDVLDRMGGVRRARPQRRVGRRDRPADHAP